MNIFVQGYGLLDRSYLWVLKLRRAEMGLETREASKQYIWDHYLRTGIGYNNSGD